MQQEWIDRLLGQLAQQSRLSVHRSIILFHSVSDYRQCVGQIRRIAPPLHTLPTAGIRYYPELHAISCPLTDPECLQNADSQATVAPDSQIRLNAKFFLPSSTKPALTFDSKQRIPWGVAAVRAPQVWKYTKGRHIRIGVVDTGADFEHPDIKHALRKGVNLLHRLSPATDDNGHGTHIAGTIAAACKNGIYGVAPGAQLYPVKAFDSDGSAYISDIILAIHWCIANRMHIINMSFGMTENNAALLQAVKAASRRGVIIVASSGNSGQANQTDYPAKFPQTIAVGAVNRRGAIAGFSNRGGDVDIYAPGESIYSTWPGNRYNELSGTSMATAHVSGALALLMAARPRLSKLALRAVLLSSAVPFTSARSGKPGRAGKLNAARAIKLLQAPGKLGARKPVKRKSPQAATKKRTSSGKSRKSGT